MKFFKCHASKYQIKNVIILPDKFNDIGPDAFEGVDVEFIQLSNATKVIRDYAFAGVSNCKIYLPDSITDFEMFALDNLGTNVVFYCPPGGRAEQECLDNRLTVNNDVTEFFNTVNRIKQEFENEILLLEKVRIEEQIRKEEEERLERERIERERIEEEQRLEKERIEEQKRIEKAQLEEQRRIEQARIEEEQRIEREKAEQQLINEQNSNVVPDTNETPAYSKCPFCSSIIDARDSFCSYCGKNVKNVKVCNRCNEISNINDKFCSYCGLKF